MIPPLSVLVQFVLFDENSWLKQFIYESVAEILMIWVVLREMYWFMTTKPLRFEDETLLEALKGHVAMSYYEILSTWEGFHGPAFKIVVTMLLGSIVNLPGWLWRVFIDSLPSSKRHLENIKNLEKLR